MHSFNLKLYVLPCPWPTAMHVCMCVMATVYWEQPIGGKQPSTTNLHHKCWKQHMDGAWKLHVYNGVCYLTQSGSVTSSLVTLCLGFLSSVPLLHNVMLSMLFSKYRIKPFVRNRSDTNYRQMDVTHGAMWRIQNWAHSGIKLMSGELPSCLSHLSEPLCTHRSQGSFVTQIPEQGGRRGGGIQVLHKVQSKKPQSSPSHSHPESRVC